MSFPAEYTFPITEWPEPGQWTLDDWMRLPCDGWSYDVIDGTMFITPMPSTAHQRALGRLCYALGRHIDLLNSDTLVLYWVGVRLPNQPVPFVPDLIFLREGRKSLVGEDFIEGVSDIIFEILLPSHRNYERHEKLLVYEEAGVPEYWLVDLRDQTVEVLELTEGKCVLAGKWEMNDVASSCVLPGFHAPVANLFMND